jgi:hypothetical protein
MLQTVRYHMVSDVPVEHFLVAVWFQSVVGMMSKLSNQPVKTFSVEFHTKITANSHSPAWSPRSTTRSTLRKQSIPLWYGYCRNWFGI